MPVLRVVRFWPVTQTVLHHVGVDAMRKRHFTDEKGTVAPDGVASVSPNRSMGCRSRNGPGGSPAIDPARRSQQASALTRRSQCHPTAASLGNLTPCDAGCTLERIDIAAPRRLSNIYPQTTDPKRLDARCERGSHVGRSASYLDTWLASRSGCTNAYPGQSTQFFGN